MKNYNDFIQEAVAVPETVKALKKRFKGTKDVKKSSTKKQLPGSKVGSVIVPKAQPSQIRDYLIYLVSMDLLILLRLRHFIYLELWIFVPLELLESFAF